MSNPPVSAPAQAPAAPDPNEKKQALRARISELEAKVKTLEALAITLDPAEAEALKSANQDFEKSISRLKSMVRQLMGLLTAQLRESDQLRELRGVREAAIQFFTQMKVNPDQWKNLGS
jgi:hypothetical protein